MCTVINDNAYFSLDDCSMHGQVFKYLLQVFKYSQKVFKYQGVYKY